MHAPGPFLYFVLSSFILLNLSAELEVIYVQVLTSLVSAKVD